MDWNRGIEHWLCGDGPCCGDGFRSTIPAFVKLAGGRVVIARGSRF
jgi:hypothetical protein